MTTVMITPTKVSVLTAAVATVMVVGGVGAATGVGPSSVEKAVGGSSVYDGMSDDEIVAYDQQAAATHDEQLAAYIAAHRSSLEHSLEGLPTREALASMRAFGPTLADTVATVDMAIWGHVSSVSIEDDGSITAHIRVTDVGKHGRTGVVKGQVIDVHQFVHLDLDAGSPIIVTAPGIPPVVPAQDGIYFLDELDFGFAASYAGAVLPVRSGVVAAPDAPIGRLVAGQSAADLMASVKGIAGE